MASNQFPFSTKLIKLLCVLYYLNYGFDEASFKPGPSQLSLPRQHQFNVQWALLKMGAYSKNIPAVPIVGLDAINNPG